MGLKVHIQGIWPSPEKNELLGTTTAAIYEGQDKLMRRVFGADVELRTRFNDRSSYYTSCSSMEAYNVVGMLEGLREAEREGCDVAFISCGNDPGLQAARDLLRIPVVSATESAMLVACMLGGRFGVVTFDDASTVLIERNLRSYGLEERALRVKPARSAGFYEATDRWFTDPGYLRDQVIPRFEKAALGLIEDGAEVIVAACGNYAAFPLAGYTRISGTEVPIVDAFLAGAQMARTIGEMHRNFGISTSKQRSFKGVPAELAAQVLAPFRIDS